MQNRVGILTAFIYAAIVAQGGYKMLFGSEHPAEAGRRRVKAPERASKRLPMLMLDRRTATKLWHTGCVAKLRNSAADAAVAWGRGGSSNGGKIGPACPLSSHEDHSREFLSCLDVSGVGEQLLRSASCRLR